MDEEEKTKLDDGVDTSLASEVTDLFVDVVGSAGLSLGLRII